MTSMNRKTQTQFICLKKFIADLAYQITIWFFPEKNLGNIGFESIYLLTDHTELYEKCD